MQRRSSVVAIDGPSGSGKSTVARTVARARGLRYLDTGAMYRALTWLVLHRHIDPADADAVADLARNSRLTVATDDPDAATVSIDGVDVTAAIREADVTGAVSAVSAVPEVRQTMVERQREIIGSGGIVVEGRDIGTTVVPDASVKVFLTADPTVRAARRDQEDRLAGRDSGIEEAGAAALQRRDAADSTRATSPLRQAEDALVIDSSVLSVAAVVALIESALDRSANTAATRRP